MPEERDEPCHGCLFGATCGRGPNTVGPLGTTSVVACCYTSARCEQRRWAMVAAALLVVVFVLIDVVLGRPAPGDECL